MAPFHMKKLANVTGKTRCFQWIDTMEGKSSQKNLENFIEICCEIGYYVIVQNNETRTNTFPEGGTR